MDQIKFYAICPCGYVLESEEEYKIHDAFGHFDKDIEREEQIIEQEKYRH